MSDKPQSTSNGQQCSVCGYRNRPGVLVCENCGTQLVALTRGTESPQKPQPREAPTGPSDPTEPTARPAVPAKKKSGTMPAVGAETAKPGMTAQELQAGAPETRTESAPAVTTEPPSPAAAEAPTVVGVRSAADA